MEGKTQSKPVSVSRLPKFGGGNSKLSETLPQPILNGACVRSVSASSSSKHVDKQNGIGRVGAFTFNWKKSGKTKSGGQDAKDPVSSFPCADTNEELIKIEKNSYSKVPLVKDHTDLGFKSKSAMASSHQKQQQIVPYVEENKILVAGLNHSTKGNRGKMLGKPFTASQISRSQSIGHFHKTAVVKMSEQKGPFSRPSSSKDSLTQSTESLKNLSDENIVRSQSFSYSIQSNSCGTDVIPRSLSFSKAVDVSRSCLRQQIRTSLPLKSNVLCYGNTRGTDSSSTGELLCKRTSSRPCLKAPSSAFKKSQLPSCSTSPFYAVSSASKITRPSLIKCGRLASSGKGSNVNAMSGTIEEIPGTPTIDESGSNNENVDIEHTADNMLNVSTVGENTVHGINEELESSSGKYIDDPEILTSPIGSNCDINDKSEHLPHSSTGSIEILDSDNSISTEIPDDFCNPNEAMSSDAVEETLISAYTGTEWIETALSDQCKDLESSQITVSGNDLVSPDVNYAMGSSFELSPSSSSAGTYMWDEEGMEALGTVQQCGSLESSEMNSLDILNNLESGDLDEDDLMLDVDLPEDTPCKMEACESMAHLERSERGSRNQGFWRKRYPRWSGQEQYHHGNNELQRSPIPQEPPVGHFDWHAASNYYRPPSSHLRTSRPMSENTVMLDVLTLRHMVHDCTAVKTQILKLKRLLQQNDDGTPLNDLIAVVSPTQEQTEAINSEDKTDELVGEIQGLREEIKRKDQMIEQLQQQLSIRCNCQKENCDTKGPAFSNADKTTQTVYKGTSPPVLQPSSHTCSSKELGMGKVAKPVHIEDPSRCMESVPSENVCQTNQNAKAAVSSEMDSDELSFLLAAQLKIGDSNDRPVQEHPVYNKARQNLHVPPKEQARSQVSVQQASLPSSSVFTEDATNKDNRLRFAFRQCLPSKDTSGKSKIQSSIGKSSLISKARKNAASVSHIEILPVESPVQPFISGQKESEHQLRLTVPISTQKDEQQKRNPKLPPSLSSPLLNIKTAEFSTNPGSLAKETPHIDPSEYRDESRFEILPSNKLQKKQPPREDRSRKDQGYNSQPEKFATSVRHSRLPKPKTHAPNPSNCNFQG